MIREQVLYQADRLTIARYDHPPARRHHDPIQEVATAHAVSLIERGAFDVVRGRDHVRMTARTLFVTHPGLSYRCQHDDRYPTDDCLTVSPSEQLAEEIASSRGTRFPALAPAVPATNSAVYQFARLGRLLARQIAACDADDVEISAFELLSAVFNIGGSAERLHRPGQIAWYAARVDAARERMDADFASPHPLSDLAADAGMSAFHFARTFTELTGGPPHAYLLAARLAAAARMLRDGASVTETAFGCGFGNLSHFIRSFRRRFGVPPSRFK